MKKIYLLLTCIALQKMLMGAAHKTPTSTSFNEQQAHTHFNDWQQKTKRDFLLCALNLPDRLQRIRTVQQGNKLSCEPFYWNNTSSSSGFLSPSGWSITRQDTIELADHHWHSIRIYRAQENLELTTLDKDVKDYVDITSKLENIHYVTTMDTPQFYAALSIALAAGTAITWYAHKKWKGTKNGNKKLKTVAPTTSS